MNYNDIDLNLIKTFVSVTENKTIITASKKLYVSQPAVTSSIKRLEQTLGGKLFIRSPKGMKLTQEGKVFYEKCKDALLKIDKGINLFTSFLKLEKGVIKIGSSSTIIRHMILPFIDEFSKKYPNIKISITDGISTQLTNYLHKSEVDLAIMSTPIEKQELFDTTQITKTHDCFIASKTFLKENNLQQKTLSKDQLKNYPLILQKRPSNSRDFFEHMCRINNVVLEPRFEMASFGLITDFTAKDMGIGYTIKEFIKNDLKNNRVCTVKTDFKIKPRNVVVLTPKISENSFLTTAFIKEMKDYFNKKTKAKFAFVF